MEELYSLVKALHSRGTREKVLQKQLQKYMEYMTQLCTNSKDGWSPFPLLSLSQDSTDMRCNMKVLLFDLLLMRMLSVDSSLRSFLYVCICYCSD